MYPLTYHLLLVRLLLSALQPPRKACNRETNLGSINMQPKEQKWNGIHEIIFIVFYVVLTIFPQQGLAFSPWQPFPGPAVREIVEALAERVELVNPIEQDESRRCHANERIRWVGGGK